MQMSKACATLVGVEMRGSVKNVVGNFSRFDCFFFALVDQLDNCFTCFRMYLRK